ncbi:hydrolase, alpha/beta hydrolase fold family [Indibacter alkaliphilus LW1]|uniref:Hydrolase, alpha/beta hydrolase fold family n=1 Tax=Indibacter alkaliphilus (strain CCUG 57479 / KCTC 22604 / LW1) TaxID=1189612 RepID=S2DI27_INDAL|nr:alpha/beta hydrolase [Indibacter alkaliphilus]EOZ98629.1 hydrolase, alpha/beta hydrolase fold family [Indibacter alkaliphilus LW1]
MKKALLLFLKVIGVIAAVLALIIISMYRSDIAPEKLLAKYTDSNSYFLKVGEDNIHVRVKGRGEPIFLIHGSFSSLHTWEPWEKELSNFFTTISMDLPGHGLTGPVDSKAYGVSDYADLVFQIAEQLAMEEFHVAGNSMGGAVALKMASDHPERVLSLNLIDASGASKTSKSQGDTPNSKPYDSGATIFKIARNPLFNNFLLKFTPKAIFKVTMEEVFYDKTKIEDDLITRYYELLRREGNRKATLDRLTTYKPYEIDFNKLNMPVLIMWGEEDQWIPLANGVRLNETIKGSKLKVFEKTGHVPMEERPTDTVREYLAFLGIQVDSDYFSSPKIYSYAN